METIAEYIKGGGSHFISLERIPVLSVEATVNDVLRTMHEQETKGVLVHDKSARFRLVTDDQLARVAIRQRGGLGPQLKLTKVRISTPGLDIVDVSKTRVAARPASRGGVVGVAAKGKLVGLLTAAEDFEVQFFAKPTLYICAQGHYYTPPPPRSCRIDGTAVGPA